MKGAWMLICNFELNNQIKPFPFTGFELSPDVKETKLGVTQPFFDP